MDKHTKIARIIGQTVGIVLVGCAAVCLCGIMISLSVKLLAWIL